MGTLFGTDGVRGAANSELSALLALQLGVTAAHVLIEHKHNTRILIGRDPRISGDILESALVAGVCSMGVDAVIVGIIPTPGVAYLTAATNCAAGVVISASHNPVKDNGIKFFGSDGYKLDDSIEQSIEQQIRRFDSFPRPQGADVGKVMLRPDLVEQYVGQVKQSARIPLAGMKLVIDCANGAASEIAPRMFEELGARAVCLNCSPNGININHDCGSMHPQQMQDAVIKHGADAGIAFDGDADRVIMSDESGAIVDGDHIMAIYGLYHARANDLPGNLVVGTIMSNIGLELALAMENVSLVRAAVGDRYVWEQMRTTGAAVGGEKSGHIILSRHSSTGDGMVTALQVLSIMIRTGDRLSRLASQMHEYPQILINVKVEHRQGWDKHPDILKAIESAEQKLEGRGRVVVRPSGTERLIRVMAEGPDADELEELTQSIALAVKAAQG